MKTYEDLLKKYGQSYLAEMDGDRYITPMEVLEDVLEADEASYMETIRMAACGWDFDQFYNNGEVERLNICRDFFFFDWNDNIVSVSKDCFLGCLNFSIDKFSFLTWLHKNKYIKKKKIRKLMEV